VALSTSELIGPNTAFQDLIRINPFVGHGVPTLVTFTAALNMTGATGSSRQTFFRLVHGPAATTVLQGLRVALSAADTGDALSVAVAISFLVIAPPVNATDQYAVQWSTNANVTANVDGTALDVGGGSLIVQELGNAATSIGVVGSELIFDTRQANNPVDILRQIQLSLSEFLLVSPIMQLVDVVISGGGAGNVYLVELAYRLPPVADTLFPAVSTLSAAVAFGPDRTTNSVALNRIRTANPLAQFLFWANAAAGDGVMNMTVLLYIAGPPPGPTFAASLRSGGTVTPSPIERVPVRTAKPVTVLNFKPAAYREPPPPTKPRPLK
jgi:hypothetical protein